MVLTATCPDSLLSRLTILAASKASLPSPHCVGCCPASMPSIALHVRCHEDGQGKQPCSRQAALQVLGRGTRLPLLHCLGVANDIVTTVYRAYDASPSPQTYRTLCECRAKSQFDFPLSSPACTVLLPACTSDEAGHRTTTTPPSVVA